MNLRLNEKQRTHHGRPIPLGATEGTLAAAPPEGTDTSARWPERIRALASSWRSERSGDSRDHLLGELWTLVNLVLQRYARASAGRLGGLDREEIRDIAADKALELLGRLETDRWDPSTSTPAEVCAFLASVARHGVVDRLRAVRRESLIWEDGTDPISGAGEEGGPAGSFLPGTDSAEHARAIAQCAACLTPRARRAWILRVFHEFSSVDIARHPAVASTPAAVDAMLLRCRKLMKTCMLKKGLDPSALPAGTFTMLWELLATGRAPAPARPLGEPER